jgi:phosphatidylglycerophosphate synthase
MTSEANPPVPLATVLLRATRDESGGASLRVAGLLVAQRNLRQLAAMKIPVVLASDGSCPLPTPLPGTVATRTVASPQDLERLRQELPGATEIGADEVYPAPRDLSGGIRVTDEASRRRAEDAVFAELLHGNLGIVARHLNKPISFRITRYLLCRLPFSPNQVTVAAALVALVGAALIATGARGLMILGFFLIHTQSVLDGCDGELARVRFQQSAFGEWLDTLVDESVNTVLFACIGLGLWRATGSTLALALGLAESAVNIFYDVVAFTELRRQGEGGDMMRLRWRITGGLNMKTRTSKGRFDPVAIMHGAARRDFFILAFLVYAVMGVPFLSLVHAAPIAAGMLVLATSQVVWHPSQRG